MKTNALAESIIFLVLTFIFCLLVKNLRGGEHPPTTLPAMTVQK